MEDIIHQAFHHLSLPASNSHKGKNGKLLLIGGSELFHAASRWSLDIASKLVDMVFYASVPANNDLIKEAKGKFWNGIVIPQNSYQDYVAEADVVLIGPGMDRSETTKQLIDDYLKNNPTKKTVIDAGALQMLNPDLLHANCILTPHQQEMTMLLNHAHLSAEEQKIFNFKELPAVINYPQNQAKITNILQQQLHGVTLLLKGQIDYLFSESQIIPIEGGNAGLTKGGTGDVLAGLIAGLYCMNDALTSCLVGSDTNKQAGDFLYQQVGPFYNASDLVTAIPQVLWNNLKKYHL